MQLLQQRCQRDVEPLDTQHAASLLQQLQPDWQISSDGKYLERRFRFGNYHETLAFINAIAQVAHKQDHHPDICFGYKHCDIRYSTHSVGGLSLNDFICAAKIDVVDAL